MTVKIEVIHVADCPHVPEALNRLRIASKDLAVQVETIEVCTDSEAAALGMRGSPTILIDGRDLFTPRDVPVGMACRVAPGSDPLPTTAQLRAAIASSNRLG